MSSPLLALPLTRLNWRMPRRVPVLGALFGALAGAVIACGLVRVFGAPEAGA